MQCLVAFELKAEKFKPEHLGQLNFYLEALDNRAIRLISTKENSRLFTRGVSDGWRIFDKRYPAYAGIIFLSPVYFDPSHTKAIYQLSLANASCSNNAHSIIALEKDKNGKWHQSVPVN